MALALEKIVSGGQSGVDRGALDAALALDFACGGWCPAGRLAEDGPIPERYPVVELAGADYRRRTTRNVLDSDATLILAYGPLSGGTRQTRHDCVRCGKPFLVIDAAVSRPTAAAAQAAAFVERCAARVLNVAGPRESNWTGARAHAEETVRALILRARRARSSA
jgi:hypothetical protein